MLQIHIKRRNDASEYIENIRKWYKEQRISDNQKV